MRCTLAKSIPPNLLRTRGNWYHTKTSETVRTATRYTSLPKRFLGNHERPHIRIHRQTCRRRSITTVGPDYLPFNVPLVKLLTDGVLEDALENGTKNWDVTWNKYTSILLVAALTTMPADILPTVNRPEFLQWQDIEMKFSKQSTDHLDVHAEVHLRKSNRTVILQSQKHSGFNTLCLIKALLVLALRRGVVYGTTITKIVNDAIRRNDGRIRWTAPGSPVISQNVSENMHLLYTTDRKAFRLVEDRSFHVRSFRLWLKQASLYAGISRPIVFRDLLESSGHNEFLVSHLKLDKRLPSPGKRKQRGEEIPKWCQDNDYDPKSGPSRRRADRALAKFEEQELSVHVEQSAFDSRSANILDKNSDPQLFTVTHLDQRSPDIARFDEDVGGFDCTSNSSQHKLVLDASKGENYPLITDDANSIEHSKYDILRTSPLHFIEYFSGINIAYFSSRLAKSPKSFEGGSKNPLSYFNYPCKNKPFGCKFRSWYLDDRKHHEAFCKTTENAIPEQFKCTEDECTKSYRTNKALSEQTY